MTSSHLRVVTTLVVSSLLGLLSLGQAASQHLTACDPITEPGAYVVDQNINATGDCFVIQTDNVDLNLGGFTLTGDGPGSGVTDSGTAFNNITVRNGAITGFDTGVNLAASTGSSLQNLRLLGNTANGLLAGDSSRVVDCMVSGHSITGVTAGAGSRVAGNVVTGGATGLSVTCPTLTTGNMLTGSAQALSTNGDDCLSVNDAAINLP